VVVGRQADLERLRRVIQAAAVGTPGCVFLTGEGGIGKTRLLNETMLDARRRGLAVLVGRASIGASLSFGVIAEALRSWLRTQPGTLPPPSVYDSGLQLVLPEWPAPEPAIVLTDSQVRLLALEGLVDLVRKVASAGRGLVLVVDDVHAADPESLEALRYVVSAGLERVAIIGASRVGESALADHLMETLAHQGLAEIWPVQPLAAADVGDLLAALLGTRLPEEFVDEVLARADGIPLFVEEILDAHLRAGSLVLDERGAFWRGGVNVVPRTVAVLVASRLDRLAEVERNVVTAGAIVGPGDADLLATVSMQSPATVRAALTAAVDAGLLEMVGGQVEFRHAVVGDAVRDQALADVRRGMHARAAAALAPTAPGDDTTLERVAAHLAAIGDQDRAAGALIEAAIVSGRAHALLRAESLAERARAIALSPAVVDAACDALAAVLAAQGRWADELVLDRATTARSGYSPDRWMRMARCALDGRLLDVVRELAHDATDVERGHSPFFDVTVGRLAVAIGDTTTALECARRAIDAAGDDAVSACAAFDLKARALDLTGRRDDAAAAWGRQQEVAAEAGLTAERIRGLVSLAELELFQGQPPRRMYEAVEVARAAGALVEQAWGELNLSIALSIQGDPVSGARLAAEAAERCRRHRLDLLPFSLMAQLGAAHILGDPAFEAMLAEARLLGGDVGDAVVHASGIAGAHYLHLGRYDEAIVELQRVTDVQLAEPGSVPSDSPYLLVLAFRAAGRDKEAGDALSVAQQLPDAGRWYANKVTLTVAEAVLAGDEAAVDAAVSTAAGRMPFSLALLRVLAAETLGGPSRERWLREALDLYEAHDGNLAIDRVRGLLREAGATVPRRRRRKDLVPPHLIAFGVTAREAEILGLVDKGQSNGAIADKLYLSVRTVESHVSSLLAKLGVASRSELTALSRQ
jgi:DNA-binding CsgD family transcriptional regulator/tetratricopeptide (TPR) repeat protein